MRTNLNIEVTTPPGSAAAAAPSSSPKGDAPIVSSVPSRGTRLIGQLVNFGLIGALAFVVDLGVYNAFRATLLQDAPIWCKVASVAVATVVAWLGNRYLTFRRERSPHAAREGLLFAVINVMGLLIAAACLFVSHYVLGFTSQLADNIAGNGVGLVLGTAFRFVAYRWLVFSPPPRIPHLPLPAPRTVPLDSGGLS